MIGASRTVRSQAGFVRQNGNSTPTVTEGLIYLPELVKQEVGDSRSASEHHVRAFLPRRRHSSRSGREYSVHSHEDAMKANNDACVGRNARKISRFCLAGNARLTLVRLLLSGAYA